MGGMQVLEWARAMGPRLHRDADRNGGLASSQNIAFHEVGAGRDGRSDWRQAAIGARHRAAQRSRRGAHGSAHHYLSERHCSANSAVACRTAPRLSASTPTSSRKLPAPPGLDLRRPFRRNSYLYITRAIDYFDLAAEHGDVLANAFKGTKTRFCVCRSRAIGSIHRESREIVQALNA